MYYFKALWAWQLNSLLTKSLYASISKFNASLKSLGLIVTEINVFIQTNKLKNVLN